jgi:hypothetical protein
MEQITVVISIIVVLALCQGWKAFRIVTTNRYVPLIALGLGVLASFAFQGGVVLGLVMGLAAIGLYSGFKSVFFNK